MKLKKKEYVKKISCFALSFILMLTMLPAQNVNAKNVKEEKGFPKVTVKDSKGIKYISRDLCNFIQSAGFNCYTGNNEANIFNNKTTVNIKDADRVELYGFDIAKEGKDSVVNFVDTLEPQYGDSVWGNYIKSNKLKFSDLKNKVSEILDSVDCADRYGEYLYSGTNNNGKITRELSGIKDNGTDYVYDLYVLYAYNSKTDKYKISFFIPDGSKHISFIDKKEEYIYQNISINKSLAKYDAVKLGWDKCKKLNAKNKSVKLDIGAKAKGKISYTELLWTAWYSCPKNSKYIGENGKQRLNDSGKYTFVTKKGVLNIKKNNMLYGGCILIKAEAKGNYATTYRVFGYTMDW